MNEIYMMIRRNMKNYFRDKSAVFFSLLSTLIIIMLMVVFLGSMNNESVVDMLQEFGSGRDIEADRKSAEYLIQMWILAGILVTNSVTVTLTVMGTMVQDETGGKAMAFYVTPVKRWKLTLGYIGSAWLIGTFMCMVTLVIGELYMVLRGNPLLQPAALVKVIGLVALNALVYATIGYLLSLFIHSNSAWSGMLTVIGTLVGFAGGIYISIGSLSENLGNVLKCLPVIHGTAMMREVCMEQAMTDTFAGIPDEVITVFCDRMGITLRAGNHLIDWKEQVLFLLGYVIIALVISVLVNRKRKLKDR